MTYIIVSLKVEHSLQIAQQLVTGCAIYVLSNPLGEGREDIKNPQLTMLGNSFLHKLP